MELRRTKRATCRQKKGQGFGKKSRETAEPKLFPQKGAGWWGGKKNPLFWRKGGGPGGGKKEKTEGGEKNIFFDPEKRRRVKAKKNRSKKLSRKGGGLQKRGESATLVAKGMVRNRNRRGEPAK